MARLYLLLADPLPENLHGSFRGHSVRELTRSERISVEDYFFRQGERLSLPSAVNALVSPDMSKSEADKAGWHMIGEFALALLAKQGHPKIEFTATFDEITCVESERGPTGLLSLEKPRFAEAMSNGAGAQWLYRCWIAHKNHPERFTIAATRYVRFSRFQDPADSLLDLCIALESLLDSQTEIAFRFRLTLVKLLGERGTAAELSANILSELYSLRSKIAHGDPTATKLLKQVLKNLCSVRELSRRILVIYVLFLGDNTRDNWKAKLQESIYA